VRCHNLSPGFRCDPCPAGFTGAGVQGAGLEDARRARQQCSDIDECADGRNGGCVPNSQCLNSEVKMLIIIIFYCFHESLISIISNCILFWKEMLFCVSCECCFYVNCRAHSGAVRATGASSETRPWAATIPLECVWMAQCVTITPSASDTTATIPSRAG
jgi:hypothetical protein